MTSTRHDDRRRFSRITFHRPVELQVGGERIPCALLDVSLKGALVEAPAGLRAEEGKHCNLVIRLDAGDVQIHMGGVVVHRKRNQLGVRCTEIDLDSIAHLRRLVELNIGDDALLHRELSALVGG